MLTKFNKDRFDFRPRHELWAGPLWRGAVLSARSSTTDFVRGGTHTAHAEMVWNAKVWKFMHKNSYFGKYVGRDGTGAMVEKKTDLLKGHGDRMQFSIDLPITDSGKIDDETVEGNEVSMEFFEYYVDIHQWRQAIRLKGKKTEQTTSLPLRERAKTRVGGWGHFMIDANTALAMSGLVSNNASFAAVAASTNRKWYGGQNAAGTVEPVANDAAVDSATNNLFGPEVLEHLKRKAELPHDGFSKIQPLLIDGELLYVAFITNYQAKALKASTSWKDGHKYSDIRGRKNALFTGSLGIWDGVLIHQYDHIETRYGEGGSTATEYFESADDCASGIYVARGLFCGRSAAVHGYAQYPKMVIKKFDYGNQFGVELDLMVAVGKPKFNSEDYGVMTFDTAYVPD